ncbi:MULTISPECIES: restriction endonuclease subunit S [Streptomyces]|uniref:restriction endonuclease subunit S n=1 Tax=Streptomyces TaxID=1883 RepID=UPI0028AE6D0B|nr:restriction endonuclease subunit S [Streptomyces parvus]
MSDVELPAGWARALLGDICIPVKKVGPEGFDKDRFQYIDIGSVSGPDRQITAASWIESSDAPGRARQIVKEGDTVYSTVRPYLRNIARVPGTLEGHIASTGFAVIRPHREIDSRYIFHAVQGKFFEEQLFPKQRGVSYPAVRDADVFETTIPIPPMREQQRIVEAIEDHLSRLDAAGRELQTAQKKIASFRKSVLLSLVPESVPDSWEMSTVGEAGTIGLGRQRHPDWHHGPEMRPYLRVANVFEDRIDTSDVMEMDFSGVFDRFRLEPGDVLLNEGQSPHLVGRPALYRGTPPNVAFTNSLLRFQARPDVLPEWALMVFRRHLHARRFMREVRITTNIAHLSAKRLKPIEFPVPPLEEQKQRVQACDELMSYADAMEHALKRNVVRAKHLRSAVLQRAFTGRLVPQDPTDEPASVLLDRIRAKREAQGDKPKRAVRRSRKTATADAPPPPPASSTPSPNTAVQQELPL